MPKTSPTLAIIVPCFNEQAILDDSITKLLQELKNLISQKKINSHSFLYLVNDGSQDKTQKIIEKTHAKYPSKVRGLTFSRNFSHQNAILAGLSKCSHKADIFLTIDADLQDDITVIGKFIDAYLEKNEIVYGVRKDRKTDSYFKKTTAQTFYKLMHLMGVEIIYNHADYRLISQRALDELEKFQEVNLFLRGIFPLLGFKNKIIHYNRQNRQNGKSKYSLSKMLSLTLDGITSFSIKPLRLVTWVGFLIFLFSLIMSIWVIIDKLFIGHTVSGWASTVLPIYFIGGIQILSIGIIGEYLGKIYREVKHRPPFIIEKEL
ncbi:MAG: glycosyltransferase family 2 protein [bacterium]|nr:glycosyltransferase family 2 protein [bacterium]